MSCPGVSGPSCPLSSADNEEPRARLQIPALPEGTQVYLTPHGRAGLSLLVYSLLCEAKGGSGDLDAYTAAPRGSGDAVLPSYPDSLRMTTENTWVSSHGAWTLSHKYM